MESSFRNWVVASSCKLLSSDQTPATIEGKLSNWKICREKRKHQRNPNHKFDHMKHLTINKIHCPNTAYTMTCEYSEVTLFSILEEDRTAAGNCCTRSPSRRFFCKLSSRLFLRISTILFSLLRGPSISVDDGFVSVPANIDSQAWHQRHGWLMVIWKTYFFSSI